MNFVENFEKDAEGNIAYREYKAQNAGLTVGYIVFSQERGWYFECGHDQLFYEDLWEICNFMFSLRLEENGTPEGRVDEE